MQCLSLVNYRYYQQFIPILQVSQAQKNEAIPENYTEVGRCLSPAQINSNFQDGHCFVFWLFCLFFFVYLFLKLTWCFMFVILACESVRQEDHHKDQPELQNKTISKTKKRSKAQGPWQMEDRRSVRTRGWEGPLCVLSSRHAVVVVAVNLVVLLPVQDSRGPAPPREWQAVYDCKEIPLLVSSYSVWPLVTALSKK